MGIKEIELKVDVLLRAVKYIVDMIEPKTEFDKVNKYNIMKQLLEYTL